MIRGSEQLRFSLKGMSTVGQGFKSSKEQVHRSPAVESMVQRLQVRHCQRPQHLTYANGPPFTAYADGLCYLEPTQGSAAMEVWAVAAVARSTVLLLFTCGIPEDC